VKEQVTTCSKGTTVSRYASQYGRKIVFAKPSLLLQFTAGSSERGNEHPRSVKGEETS
jgi:hypothetical protein